MTSSIVQQCHHDSGSQTLKTTTRPQQQPQGAAMTSCQLETKKYRQCLKDTGGSGCGRSCLKQAKALETCRENWRKEKKLVHQFDGRRFLPNKKCKLLNQEVQKCMKWKKGDQSKCEEPIQKLKLCMDQEQDILAAPTAGDKVWSDYKGTR
ncbi:expressed unknown protein [Seminavis robusta]|uniref:Uncharacterized protein n=1 Tax=Seminavis robusta TaxID=568900 RepID=A0A9N8E7A3_9STRA|nr:expressed unknown protein [Seminavis robusta]|eukprot:Sro697_g189040.1 n/a (151) ;mRNA; f:20678-21130